MQAGVRRRVDDHAAALEQVGQGVAAHVEGAVEVDRDDLVERLRVLFVGVGEVADAGDVARVEAAELARGSSPRRDGALDVGRIADVALDRRRRVAPVATISAAVSSWPLMSRQTTEAPSAAKRLAVALPMPEPVPVTSTRLPTNRCSMLEVPLVESNVVRTCAAAAAALAAVLLAQVALEHLAARVARQRLDDLELLRQLVVGELVVAQEGRPSPGSRAWRRA